MMSAAPLALDSVLLRSDVWRGDRLALGGEAAVASGFAELDAELPGGGWPRGALTELLHEGAGLGELSLLRPALAACAARAPVALVAPPWRPHAPAWAGVLPLERLLLVEAAGADAPWAAEHLLASGALGALLLWLPARCETRMLRRLQLAAGGHAAPVFVLRPAGGAAGASPAVLRMALDGAPEALRVRILKRRGPPCGRALNLAVARPLAPARLRPRGANPPLARRAQVVGA
ncbi:MAG: translesion DNA synthesis-associated protein ImuA [Candidatus Dactylopiibacterium sp.]|nr:translesion DNA synthesis-associated protein ImuA [Candidatus Dactylopiibacterium sp.]